MKPGKTRRKAVEGKRRRYGKANHRHIFCRPADDAICEVTRWRQSIPWQVCPLRKSLVLLTFLKLRSGREAALLFPRVAMTSEWEGSRPSHVMIIPNTKRHPNNT